MDDKKDINVDWENYYSSVDKTTLNNLCSNNNIKNLIYLSSQMDINPFNKKNKKWQLKNKEKIIKECEQFKKKELKDFSYVLSNLAKLGTNNTSDVKHIYKNFEVKLENIDKIITCANNITTANNDNTIITNDNNINTKISNGKTTYLVEHEANSQSNIVSFNILGSNQEEKTNIKSNKNKTKTKQEETKNVEIKINDIKSPSESSENEHYLECYGNC
jgi:hypothetical protein